METFPRGILRGYNSIVVVSAGRRNTLSAHFYIDSPVLCEQGEELKIYQPGLGVQNILTDKDGNVTGIID